jgi:DNA-binding Lrp family transcriptional regulator
MDDTDFRIIEVLKKNSRASFRKIAKATGLSTDTVMRRYQKLEKEGVVQPTITVDLVKLGYEAIVYFKVKVTSQNSLPAIIDGIAEIPDVTAIIRATGEYDLLLLACAKSINHMFKIGEDIERIVGIRSVSIDHFNLTKEYTTFPPPAWHNLHLKTP